MRKRSSPVAATRLAFLALLLAAPGAALAADAGPAPVFQPTLLDVTVNGQQSDEPQLLLQDSSGALYASEAMLRQWRIRIPAAEPVRHEGEGWYRIDSIPALSATFSSADQSLVIDARPELFEGQRTSLASASRLEMTPAATGGFLNYDLFGEYFSGDLALSGAFEAGAFTSFGVGSTGFVVRAGEGGGRLVRLDTSWTIDRPGSMSSIRIGDSVSAGGPGVSPLRFGGVQYARNFAIQPGYVTMPLPVLSGSAAVPSVVDVYVNNALQGSQPVAPGPFELTNVPVQSGGGTVQLVTRDLLGRQIVSEQSYYASSVLLRRGLHDFSYEIGFLRDGFGTSSAGYGPLMASTSHRYGLSDRITLEGHLQLSEATQMAGTGLSLSLSDLGALGATASVSRSDRGTGAFVTASAERRSDGLSFGVRAEYASAAYAFTGMSDDNRPARISAQAFADLPLFGGSVGFNLIHRDRRGDAEDENVAGVFGNVRLTDGASVQLFARRAVAGQRSTVLGAHLSLSLGGRRHAAASAEYRGGSLSHNISYQEAAPAGVGSGYRASASVGNGTRTAETVYTWNAHPASFTAHLSQVRGSTGVRLSASGAIGMIGARPFLSRALGESFAEVRVGRHPGVRVYADNQLVGVTGSDGRVVVPTLRPFDRNLIKIEESDLPLDVQLAATELEVRPFARSGAIVSFDARRERGVLMQVRLEDGSPLPPGALVRVEGGSAAYVTASAGEVYMADLSGSARLVASWDGGSCAFDMAVPEGDDPQPRIEGLTCRAVPVYAAR
jgi:outer membrane usher protein